MKHIKQKYDLDFQFKAAQERKMMQNYDQLPPFAPRLEEFDGIIIIIIKHHHQNLHHHQQQQQHTMWDVVTYTHSQVTPLHPMLA